MFSPSFKGRNILSLCPQLFRGLSDGQYQPTLFPRRTAKTPVRQRPRVPSNFISVIYLRNRDRHRMSTPARAPNVEALMCCWLRVHWPAPRLPTCRCARFDFLSLTPASYWAKHPPASSRATQTASSVPSTHSSIRRVHTSNPKSSIQTSQFAPIFHTPLSRKAGMV